MSAALTAPSQTSGDLLIDRRFGYAQALLSDGDLVAAIDLLRQITEATPRWVAGWMALAEAAERSGDAATAAEAYEAASLRDRDGAHAAGAHVARLRGERTGAALPASYIAALFDGYASRFDHHLVDGLGYSGPAVIMSALERTGAPGAFDRGLDLGCGTGLMARALKGAVRRLDGVDLSPRMVAAAARTGLYHDLIVGPLDEALAATPPGHVDLVVAADVFVYCGPLGPSMASCARALRAGGLLAFTLQAGDAPIRLGDDMRFAHSAGYARDVVAGAGLTLLLADAVSTRREAGMPVPGLVVVARRP